MAKLIYLHMSGRDDSPVHSLNIIYFSPRITCPRLEQPNIILAPLVQFQGWTRCLVDLWLGKILLWSKIKKEVLSKGLYSTGCFCHFVTQNTVASQNVFQFATVRIGATLRAMSVLHPSRALRRLNFLFRCWRDCRTVHLCHITALNCHSEKSQVPCSLILESGQIVWDEETQQSVSEWKRQKCHV